MRQIIFSLRVLLMLPDRAKRKVDKQQAPAP